MDFENTGSRNVLPVPGAHAVFAFGTSGSGTRAIPRTVLASHERENR
jgi:hypothetical protein